MVRARKSESGGRNFGRVCVNAVVPREQKSTADAVTGKVNLPVERWGFTAGRSV